MNSTPRRIALAALANLMVFALCAHDWPEFRGPTGQGHSPGKNVPIRWSATENVAWKTAIPGSGWSSPVLVDGRLYLTTAKPTEGAKDLKLTAICLDSRDEKLLWSTNVFSPQDGSSLHRKNGYASPTPLVRDGRIYVHISRNSRRTNWANARWRAMRWTTARFSFAAQSIVPYRQEVTPGTCRSKSKLTTNEPDAEAIPAWSHCDDGDRRLRSCEKAAGEWSARGIVANESR